MSQFQMSKKKPKKKKKPQDTFGCKMQGLVDTHI